MVAHNLLPRLLDTRNNPILGSLRKEGQLDVTFYHFTRVSSNTKTGPIPVTTSSADTCPPSCSFKDNGCYAEHGNLALHWKAVSAGTRGGGLNQLLEDIRELPRNQLWRHNQAGDLSPSSPGEIDLEALALLATANQGRRGFTYTHYAPTVNNRAAIRMANDMGFTVNMSAETLEQADEYAALGIAPVVCTLPADAVNPVQTPTGNFVIVCPASVENTDCLNCGICQKVDRQAIVGFPAHGSRAANVQKIFWSK